MTTISERLREYAENVDDLVHTEIAIEAADTIDALVAALEETLAIAERNESGDFGNRARAALALARK